MQAIPVVGSLFGAYSTHRAGERAADATQAASEANNEQSQAQYEQSRQDLAPWRDSGGAALSQLNALLGLGNPTGATPGINPNAGSPTINPNSGASGNFGSFIGGGIGGGTRNAQGFTQGLQIADAQNQPQPNEQIQQDAFSAFRNTPGYQFQLEQGQQAIDRGAAARGGALSGRAIKETQRFGSGLADQSYNNYIRNLQSQAGLGQSSANTTVQLGANNVANQGNNNQASAAARGSAYQQTGQAINGGLEDLGYLYGRRG